MSRSARLALGSVTVMVVALLVAAWATGALAPAVLADPGPLVRWGLPVVSSLARVAAVVTLGALLLGSFVLPPGITWERVRDAGILAAAAWSSLQAAELLLTFLNVVGGWPEQDPLGQLRSFLGLDAGQALALATLSTAALAVVALLARTPRGTLAAFLLGVVALLQLALTGHVSGAEAHGTAVLGLWLHLGAATFWIGGLAVLVVLVPPRAAVVSRYSTVAAWCFAVLAFSGVVSALVRVSSLADLTGTGWGVLLLTKVTLLLLLGTVGARHRRHTLPLLERGRPGAFLRLAVGEVLLMAAVLGLSVALGSTAPPRPTGVPASDTVVQLTGYPAPPAPGLVSYLTQVRVEPVALLLAVSGIVVYLRWVARLRRRGDAWPVGRTVSAVLGLVLFAWVTSGGLAVYASVQFSAHMAQHLALVSVLPIAYALAAPTTLALRALPRRDDGSFGPREWLLALLHSRVATFLARPVVAAVHVVLSMAVLYFTPLHHLMLTSHVAHLLIVLHLSVAGYLFTNALIGTDPGPRRPHHGVRLVLLLPSMIFHTFFGLGLLSSTGLMAADYYARLALPWLADPLADQRIGGALMWAMGEIPALALALIIALRWAFADDLEQERARRRERRARPGHDTGERPAEQQLPSPEPAQPISSSGRSR